jgi:hypothetical protein
MGERMTDERREHLAGFPGRWCTQQQEEVNAELDRARASEKALADALRKARGFVHGRGDLSKAVRDEIDAALDAALGAAGK